MLTLITTTISIRSYVPEVCRGRNPPTILRGITHSNTHSVQKKTRNGYDNCSAKCLTLKITIMDRKEVNTKFVEMIESGDFNRDVLFAAAKSFMGVSCVEEVISRIKTKFEESDTNWYITNICEEYNHVMSLNETDAALWAKYRSGRSQQPIKDADGHYIEVKVTNITVDINNCIYSIDAQNGTLNLANGQSVSLNAQNLQVLGRIMDSIGNVRRTLE